MTKCMWSLPSHRLENWLRASLLSLVSLIEQATKRAITAIHISLFFNIESTPRSVVGCFLDVFTVFSNFKPLVADGCSH